MQGKELRVAKRRVGLSEGVSPNGPAEQRLWRADIYDQIREVMSRQGSLSIERMCQLVPVSRAGFYRSLQEQRSVEEEHNEPSDFIWQGGS